MSVMSSTPTRILLLLGALVGLAGCPGTLNIVGIDICADGTVPPCDGSGGDDDDAIGPGLDLSVFDGVEWLNITWTAEALADNHFNCKEAWEAEGVEATEDVQDLCEVCDYIWTVEFEHEPGLGDEDCLAQGTGVSVPQSYTRRLGLRDTGGGSFVMYRNEFRATAPLGESEDDRLVRVGLGAFKGADWTFAGQDSDITSVPGAEYSFHFSGEGAF